MEHQVEGLVSLAYDAQTSQTLEIYSSYMDIRARIIVSKLPLSRSDFFWGGFLFVPRPSLQSPERQNMSTSSLLINQTQSLIRPTLIQLSRAFHR